MSAARLAKTAIKIPKRIERGPTDVLKALASTVKYIPTEPNSMIQDDPYLLPNKGMDRKLFALSKISGRSTAKFLLNKHPELFLRNDSEPKIRDFLPPEEFRDDMEFTIDDLRWCIDNQDAVNGVIAYNKLSENEVKIDDETMMTFFELICYTNEGKLMDPLEWQKSYYSADSERDLVDQTWNNTGLASKMFAKIKTELDAPRVYSTMIAGLSKYNEHQAAAQVFEDFKECHPKEALYVQAYDGLLSSVPNLHSSVVTIHEAVDKIVKHMEEHLVMPNLRVFNTILDIYRRYNVDEVICQIAVALVNDMRALGIEPSLFTYSSLIGTIVRYKSDQRSFSLGELLDHILANDKLLDELRDERDVEFLDLSMKLVSNRVHSLVLANKLHKIYMKRPGLFRNAGVREQYLENYFRFIITTDRIENIWQFYTANVPMMFRPSAGCYDALAEALDLYQADEEIVNRVASDIIKFRLSDRVKNDAIFRKDPNYVRQHEEAQMPRDDRSRRPGGNRRND